MKAMILAAGRGKRMGSLTDTTPKPLLKVKGQTLLENKLLAIKNAGIEDVVINVAYLGEQIQAFAGDGSRWGLNIQYSEEPEPLETGGGIAQALPLLGDEVFLAINADIWCDFLIRNLCLRQLQVNILGHLVMVKNPTQHPRGDFVLNEGGMLQQQSAGMALTYSGIALYHPDFIRNYPRVRNQFPLLEVFEYCMQHNQLSGEYFDGQWSDVGTPERLDQLNAPNH